MTVSGLVQTIRPYGGGEVMQVDGKLIGGWIGEEFRFVKDCGDVSRRGVDFFWFHDGAYRVWTVEPIP